MPQFNALLDLHDVAVAYGKARVIEDVSLSIDSGHIFGLVGLNGAGKTSLIKTILSLREPSQGSILIDGRPHGDKDSKQKLAYLPERFEPPWFLSGAEFIRFSLRFYKKSITQTDMEAQAEKIALDPAVLKRRVQTYSKGMRQKLGLLATILTGCHLLILDEPMSGLDPRARLHVKEMIQHSRDQGQTVFLSSHILADVKEICDQIAVLHDRHIIFKGAPQELCDQTGQADMEHAFLSLIKQAPAQQGAAA